MAPTPRRSTAGRLGVWRAAVQREGRLRVNPAVVFVDAWPIERLADPGAADRGARLPREEAERRVRELAAGELLPGDDHPLVVAARGRIRAKVERLLSGR